MKMTPEFAAVLDEHFPEAAEILDEKYTLRKAAVLLHEEVQSVQSWLEIMRDRARDQWDPED